MEKPLAPKYYLDNFIYLLSFVEDKYGSLLNEHERAFLHLFKELPEDAKCWWVRFTNRKGSFFKTQNVSYEELGPLEDYVEILSNTSLIEKLDAVLHVEFVGEILGIFTKAELLAMYQDAPKSLKKEDLCIFIQQNYAPKDLLEKIQLPVIKLKQELELSFIKFLFFGNRYLTMTEFVLSELGLMQYHNTHEDDMVARFSTRKEAEDKWFISDQWLLFEELKKSSKPAEIYEWMASLRDSIIDLSEIALPSWYKLQIKVGKFFEQNKDFEKALQMYTQINEVPARERRARCLQKLGYIEEALVCCQEMIESPQNADEAFFAAHFSENLRGKKNKKQVTLRLQDAKEIVVPITFRYQVERAAVQYYSEQGYRAVHSENLSWRAVFGFMFWDIIFDPSLVAFHHPFQRRPSDLHLPDFYLKRKDLIDIRLEEFQDADSLCKYLFSVFNDKLGKVNPFVLWELEMWEIVQAMVTHIDLLALKAVLLKMAQNINENARGFADLLVWNDEKIMFIEIKGPNDTLSNQQLYWLQFFNELGIHAEVLKVSFEKEMDLIL